MATELRFYTLTVPAQTPAAAPASLLINFGVRTVEQVAFVVPDGANGVVGFGLYQSGVSLVPFSSDPWVITSGEKLEYDIQEYPTTGAWELRAYNTGNLPHAITVRFALQRLGLAGAVSVPMLDDEALVDSTGTETADYAQESA